MTKRSIVLRDATAEDFAAIVDLNHAQVQHTAPMDLTKLRQLDGYSAYHRFVEVDGRFAGFLLVLREGADYDSDNYRWFGARFTQFAYVDRIVIAEPFWGLGLARRLYRDLIANARRWDSKRITCEFNVEPPNPPSAAFHASMGFVELDQQLLQGGSKRVSLQVLDLEAGAH